MENEINIDGIIYVKKEQIKKVTQKDILKFVDDTILKGDYLWSYNIRLDRNSILLDYPTCNTRWTLDVWKIARLVIDKFSKAALAHNETNNPKIQYIDVSKYPIEK